MSDDLVAKLKNHPKYLELVRKRRTFSWVMAAIVLIIYYSFIMTIAFDPEFLAQPLSPNSVITIGMPIGAAVILAAFFSTGIFVWRANTEFDRLNREIREDVL